MKWLWRVAIYLILPVFFFGGLYGLSLIPSSSAQKASEDPVREAPLKRIKVMEVIPQSLEETVLLPGSVEAYADVNLGAAIPGIVEAVYVKEGDRVTKGQELFRIDLRSREARLSDAKAAHELAVKSLERKKNLRQRGDVTIQEYDEATAQEQQAAAILRSMEVEVSLGHVYAPMDGIIDRIEAEVGEYMHEGSLLARLLSIDRVKVTVGVPEKYAAAAAREKKSLVHLEALGQIQEAALDRLAFEANSQTNTFEAKLILDNKNHTIRPGMIVRAEIVTKRQPDALMIPLFALVKRETGMVVFVEKDGVVSTRPVKMGAFQKQLVEIPEGLEPNEHIVIIGQQDLVDGQHVEVMEKTLAMDRFSQGEAQ